MALLLGYDVGSSSIKATLIDADTGQVVGSATSPKQEMEIIAVKSGWAEQHPETWWTHIKAATQEIKQNHAFDPADIQAIGVAYQMHGLVAVDKQGRVLRPSIIWCDSRAVEIGREAAEGIGVDRCLERLLNLPGNFTASKLKWVKTHEPRIYDQIDKIMLPGDYIAYKLTGQILTTPSGLSEGILWDFNKKGLADILMTYYGLDESFIPEIVPTFSEQGELTPQAAAELGLAPGTRIAYRAGDQPNNALSLNVLEPGEVAATAGTSGVVYGISDKRDYDKKSRVNTFVHVNHTADLERYGVLLCLNGTGILNSWLKHNVVQGEDYAEMNERAMTVPIGAEGLTILPFGNGAERTLENRDIGSAVHHLNFNIHTQAHVLRAAQEGIVFALNYGCDVMKQAGVQTQTIRAGYANMFLSPLFRQAFANITGAVVELYNTDGSQGAARGAGMGAGVYASAKEAFGGLACQKTVEPDPKEQEAYKAAYASWLSVLNRQVGAV
ncbi:MAG: carbohydrate kinase [Phycisphaerae bacterium]|nr:carbohydrate kinase [Phycisphaerae bacterium]